MMMMVGYFPTLPRLISYLLLLFGTRRRCCRVEGSGVRTYAGVMEVSFFFLVLIFFVMLKEEEEGEEEVRGAC